MDSCESPRHRASTGMADRASGGRELLGYARGTVRSSGSIVASAKTATVGQPLTLTWTVSAGSTCTAASTSANTAWIASKAPFTGTVQTSGERTLTETVDGTVTYSMICTAPGTAAVSVSTSVVWIRSPVIATIPAPPASITAGEAVTVTRSFEARYEEGGELAA